jgi:excisionase family DNA binding protein
MASRGPIFIGFVPMTAEEIAALFQLSVQTIYRTVQAHAIPFHRIGITGTDIRFDRDEIRQYWAKTGFHPTGSARKGRKKKVVPADPSLTPSPESI